MTLLRALKYLWEGDPIPDPNATSWILGVEYPAGEQWPPEFMADARARLWFMYRSGFPLIARDPNGPSPLQLGAVLRGGAIDANGFVSDVGWGCMIRTGQSLLANALLHLQHGRNWRFSDASADEVVALFRDFPDAPFSIHKFVAEGTPRGKLPGQWFGPSTVAGCIKTLAKDILNVYVSEGSDIYTGQLNELEYPKLVLCPIRLGINEINAVYFESIKLCFRSPQCVGIAGGRTSASHYFYGYQNQNLFFHDPHTPKPALDTDFESVHSPQLRAMDLTEMDPSMLIGFILKDEHDYNQWKELLTGVEARSRILVLSEQRQEPVFDNEVDGFVLCGDMEEEAMGYKEDEVLVTVPQVEDEAAVFV